MKTKNKNIYPGLKTMADSKFTGRKLRPHIQNIYSFVVSLFNISALVQKESLNVLKEFETI